MNTREKILDISVASLILLELFWTLVLIFPIFFNADIFRTLIHSYFEIILASTTCLTLVMWLKFGKGVESKLWLWLPPFVFFNGYGNIVKMVVVIIFTTAILIGLLSDLGSPNLYH